MPVELRTFGTAATSSSVAVKAQVDEVVKTVHFHKGQKVSKGDLLFTIDPRPFEAALKQAQANLARDAAQANNAKADAARVEELSRKGVAAPSEHDKSRAEADALAAGVQADEAAVENARLVLEHCYIRSAIDGRAGDVFVTEGNLVKANDVTLAVINQISPIDVFFSVPQDDLPIVKRYMAQGEMKVLATIPGEEADTEEGELAFLDNAVDKTTGTVMLGATFGNSRERLWPGQYVQVKLTLTVQEDAVVVPARAVQTGQNGKYVYVIREGGTAELCPVSVDRAVGEEAVIRSGLQPGQRVVTDGQLRLVQGARVEVKADSGAAVSSQPAGRPTAPQGAGA